MFRSIAFATVLVFAGAVRAQTAGLTANTTALAAGGGQVTFTLNTTFAGNPAVFVLEVSAPDDWLYVSGTGEPALKPAAGTHAAPGSPLPWTDFSLWSSPVQFSFILSYPAGTTSAIITSAVTLRQTVRIAVTDKVTGAQTFENRDVRTDLTPAMLVFGVAPIITSEPVGATVAGGTAASFRVTATGSAPLTYQWSKNGSALAGASGASLSFVSAQIADAGSYTVRVANAFGSVTTPAAALTVTAPPPGMPPNPPTAPPPSPPIPPAVAAQSPGSTITEGASATLAVTVTGTAPLAFQWRRNGETVLGATSSALVLTSARLADAGSYTAVVTNRAGSVTSGAIDLVVTPAAAVPTIVAQPQSLSALAAARVAFTVDAAGTPPLAYQWRRDGIVLSGATTRTLTLAGIQPSDIASYAVVVTNALGSVASNAATLALAPSPVAPTLTAQPAPQGAVPGGAVSFRVAVDGTAPFTYQWRRNGALLPGATADALSLTDVRVTDAGSYSVTVTNSGGSVSSSTASLAVAPPPGAPAILGEPADLTVGAGARASFRVSSSGAAPLNYEWRRNGSSLASGSVLTLTNVQAADAGIYTVVVSNALGTVTSRAATLTIRGRCYAGSYFGSFGIGGSFALAIRDDNSGVFLGYATGAHTAFLSRSIAVDDNGRFRFVSGAPPASSATRLVEAPGRVEAAGNEFTVDGVIAADGRLSGTVSGLDTTLSATRSPASGATQAVAGFYQAGALGSSATTYTIVGAAGQAFVLMNTATASDGGAGTVDAGGRILVTTAANATVGGDVAAASATLKATVTTAAGVKQDFSGGSETRATTEKLVNIATRGPVGGSAGALIAGFVISGDAAKPVLIRAIGPTLRAFGLGDALGAVRLELFNGPSSVATNIGWGRSSNVGEIAAAAARVGAFALEATSQDAVLLVTLEPGAYTAVVSGEGGASGVALVEVYDVSLDATNAQKVVNIASRSFAGSGENTLTAGFVISGDVPKRVLIRGVGPGLAGFGVGGVLLDPQLTLFKGGASVAVNDNWSDAGDTPAIAAAAASVGAFALNAGSRDAALFLNLEPGPYTVQLSGAGAVTGTALVEVYEVP